MTNARQYVPAPAFTARPYGLLTSQLDVRSPVEPHWQLGVTWEPICGMGGSTYEKCFTVSGSGLTPPQAPSSKADNGGLDRRGATAFTVFAEIDCSAPGFWERAEDVVNQQLLESEQWQVERSFWTGQAGGNVVVFPHLAANAAVTDEDGITLQTAATSVTGAVLDVVEGLGLLEQAVADCYDGVPVIHVPKALAPAFAVNQLLIKDGPRYRSPNGSIIIFGGGYRGTGPDGSQPTTSRWIYATGSMFIYRSRVTVLPVNQSINRSQNTVRAIAERTYLVGWDCCHFAVPVAVGGYVAGGAGGAGA